MSRESRLVVILLVIGGIGVSGLMVVANQYRKALVANAEAGVEDASARASRLVDGFLAARRAAKAVATKYPVEMNELTPEAALAYRAGRSAAIDAHRMSYADYAAVRAAWRAYRAEGPVNDAALLAAFRARGSAVDEAALGPFEAIDDAIK